MVLNPVVAASLVARGELRAKAALRETKRCSESEQSATPNQSDLIGPEKFGHPSMLDPTLD